MTDEKMLDEMLQDIQCINTLINSLKNDLGRLNHVLNSVVDYCSPNPSESAIVTVVKIEILNVITTALKN
jgi:hypothetical protein